MAIGDNTNSNLFGTNYNPEDEEEKKARLAAQNARIGAGNIPASAFGQAPAVAPFSLEAAGQVNPMMQPQSLEVTPQPQVTFRDYDAPEPPRASALSVFTPGGDVKPGIDVNAITPAPEMISPSAVNTALNQEVAVGPTSNEPGFLYNTFVNAPVKADQMATEFMSNLGDKISTGYDNLLGSAMRNLTPVEDRRFANNEPFGKTFTDTFAITRPDGTKFYPDEVTSPAGTTQAPSGASALGATPSVTPTTETPSEGAREQGQSIQQGAPGSAQANFATRMATGEPLTPQEIQDAQSFAASMGTTFDPATGYSREAFENAQTAQGQAATAPTNGLTTVGGASLSEFLSGQAMPEQGFTQKESPLGGRGVTLTPDQMNELSAQREARLDARLPGDQSVSDRERRAARGDGISMADQTAMAKANARDASPSEVARGNQVANALGVDLKTGQPLQATGGLTFDQIMKLQDFNFKRDQESYKREQDDLVAQGKKTEAFEKDSALLRQVSGDAGRIGRLTNEAIGLATEPGTTALSGSLLKHVAGSDANQLKSILAVISSKVALDRLMEVKKTGATLGQVSEKELAMLQNSFDALDQSLPPERLREALTNYANQLKKVEDQTQRAFIDKHGQDKFNKIMGGGSMGQGEPRFSNDVDHGAAVETHFVG